MPSARRAQECKLPAVMAVVFSMPLTSTGTEESAFSPLCPLPSCPAPLLPQHDAVPSSRSVQECSPPAVIEMRAFSCSGIAVSAEVVVVSVGVVASMEVVVVSSALELSEPLEQLAASSETRVSRQKTVRLRADGRLIVIKLSCDFAAVLRWHF